MKLIVRQPYPIVLILAAMIPAPTVFADVPRLISYQGKLRDADGTAITATVALRFRLYDGATSETPVLFEETLPAVSVTNGLFSVLLGSNTPPSPPLPGGVPDSALDVGEVWLGVSINDGEELSPRSRIGSGPHAIKAQAAERLVLPGTFDSAVTVDESGNVGVGTTTPGATLEVAGQVKVTGGSPEEGRVLTSDGDGLASWQTPATGMPEGTTGQTLRHDGSGWVADSNLYHDGASVGIGTTSPEYTLDVNGSIRGGETNLISSVSNMFPNRVEYPAESGPYSIDMGDLNGDGKPDLAVTNWSYPAAGLVSVFMNDGSGGFGGGHVNYGTGGSESTSITIADLNGDGRRDVAVVNVYGFNVSVFLNSAGSPGTFPSRVDYSVPGHPEYLAIGDVNGDGRPDLVIANSSPHYISVLLNSAGSPGTFPTRTDYSHGTHPNEIAIGDLDGDSRPDLALANADNHTISIYRNNPASPGTFLTPTAYSAPTNPGTMVIGDMNGDGRSDLAGTSWSGIVFVFLNSAASPGTFPTRVDYSVPTAGELAIVDMNADGKPDIATGTNNGIGAVTVLLNDGNGVFTTGPSYPAGPNASALVIGDLNSDSRPDLVVTSGSPSPIVSILLNAPSGSFPSFFYAQASTGRIGLGTTSPAYQLQLSTDSAAKPSSGTWTIASDRRVKKDIEPFTDGLETIERINPVRYQLNGKAGLPEGEEGISVVAQDAKDVIPYAISTYKAKLEPSDAKESDIYNFNASSLTFVLINAVKEQQAQIKQQQEQIKEQQTRIEALEAKQAKIRN